MNPPTSPYFWLLLASIAVTFWWWSRLARRDERLLLIYFAALLGAFAGAKLVYLAAEGWMFAAAPERWRIWATGKSILGALLGGYAGVELAKRALHFHRATGDFFALVAPLGILLGRAGCLLHGCCPGRACAEPHWWTLRDAAGVERWPAVPAEMAFNAAMLAVFVGLRRPWRGIGAATTISPAAPSLTPEIPRAGTGPTHPASAPPILAGQLFHLYLIAYGCFRFAHEFLRETPRWGFGLSGYHVAALGCVALGGWGFVRRARQQRDGRGGG